MATPQPLKKTEAAPANGADGLVIDTTTQGFVKDVVEESKKRPVLVDFWAPWCGPCRTLSPIIERVVRAAKGAVRLVKMNIDDHPAIPGQMGIQSIPAVIAFVDGKPIDGFLGAIPEGQVKAFIDKILKGAKKQPPETDALIKEADEALARGEAALAAELYAEVRQLDPADLRSIAGLARAAIAVRDLDRAEQMLALAPPDKANHAGILAARAELALARQAAALGDSAGLRARVAANPEDKDALFDLAIHENAAGNRVGAVDHLLAIVKRDREWNDQKARKQLVQFFEAWGAKDEATMLGRRRLSSLLFS